MKPAIKYAIALTATLIAAASPADGGGHSWRTAEAARARLHADRIAALERAYRGASGFDAFIEGERTSLANALAALESDSPPPPAYGIRLEAYFAENDGSAQPFWSYVPQPGQSPATGDGAPPPEAPPLLVYLHGYSPYIDIVNVPQIPTVLTSLVARAGACIAAPFARSNTDFQGVGEQDVFRVIEEMRLRHGIDTNRVVLAGFSMGGMGAWSIGGRFAERFNALFVISGRSDFHVWHGTTPETTPAWMLRTIDTQFGTPWLHRLVGTPVLAVHGELDPLVSVRQGRFPVDRLKELGSKRAELILFEGLGHQIAIDAFEDKRVAAFIVSNLSARNPRAAKPLGRAPGFTGSRIQDAFLSPFTMLSPSRALLERRAAEWYMFAKGEAPRAVEAEARPEALRGRALFIFGEPETSPLARKVLEDGGAKVFEDRFEFAGKTLPRAGHGLWFAGRNPFDTRCAAIVQCGAPWGETLSENHVYDRLPDVACYSSETASPEGVDMERYNLVVAAGFFGDDGTFAWCADAGDNGDPK